MKHSAGFLRLVNEDRAVVKELAAARLPELLNRRPDIVVVDIREDDEWQAGHLACAVHIGKGVIERDIECCYPDLATPLYLYCGGGYRSVLAARALLRMGYREVVSIDGGWRELQTLLPVVSS